MVEANRRLAQSTNRLTLVIAILTMAILLLTVLMVFPELAEQLKELLVLSR